jgi:hypothetical protein
MLTDTIEIPAPGAGPRHRRTVEPQGDNMKGSPRSIMLTWANRAAGWWTGATVSAVRQQQRAALKAMTAKPAKARPKRGKTATGRPARKKAPK